MSSLQAHDRTQSLVLSTVKTARFLAEEGASLQRKLLKLESSFPAASAADAAFSSRIEASLVVVLLHVSAVEAMYRESITYIESLLNKQLLDAIGREIGPKVHFTTFESGLCLYSVIILSHHQAPIYIYIFNSSHSYKM